MKNNLPRLVGVTQNPPRFVGAPTQSRLGGTGRELIKRALHLRLVGGARHPIIAVAATVVGSLLRLLGQTPANSPQRESVRAKLDSYSTSRRLRSSYTRTSSRKRASVSASSAVKCNLNPEGRRHA